MRQNQIITYIVIQNFRHIGIDFEPLIHQDIGLDAESPVFNLLKELLVLLAICLVQLVQYRVCYHLEHLFQVVFCRSLVVSYKSNIDGVFWGLVFALREN